MMYPQSCPDTWGYCSICGSFSEHDQNLCGGQLKEKTKIPSYDSPMGRLDVPPLESNEKIYHRIIHWLYVTDGTFPNKNAWRMAFLEFLQSELLDPQPPKFNTGISKKYLSNDGEALE